MMHITILGTSCMTPTKERNPAATYIEIKGIGMLFDCGEGTQRQMNIAGISRGKVRHVFLTHWHADHMAGLLGLIQTIGATNEAPELDIYGPLDSKKFVTHLMNASVYENRVKITVHECDFDEQKVIFENSDFSVLSVNVQHNTPCIAFRLQEKDKIKLLSSKLTALGVPEGPHLAQLQQGKDIMYNGKKVKASDVTKVVSGKSFAYVTDTLFAPAAVEIAKDADILLCESSFSEQHMTKADTYAHMTATQAAQIASLSGSKKLLLTHFSQRYKTVDALLDEARTIFPNTEAAHDFMEIELK